MSVSLSLTPQERSQRRFLQFLSVAPEFVRRRIAGDGLLRRNGAVLDSRIAAFMALSARAGNGFRPDLPVERVREGYSRMNRVCGLHESANVSTRDVSIDDAGGTIAARLYRPASAGEQVLPLLLYFHGGGFVIGSIADYDHLVRFFANRGRIAVLSVGYRRGPEHRFPQAFEDGFTAYGWAVRNALSLGADPHRIAVGGDSAGGTIAIDICTYGPERGLPPPAFLFPIYPGTDRRADAPYASRNAFDRGLPLTTTTITWFGLNFGVPGAERSPLLSPLTAPSLAQTPPTYLLAPGFDPFVDEGHAYAERLRESGVPVTYDLRPGLAHGFVNLAGIVPEARRALGDGIDAVSTALRK